MTHNPTTTIRIPTGVKKDANAVFKDLGISLSAAVNAFLKNVARTGRMPFELALEQSESTHREKPKNVSLNQAFIARKDEFYTQYEDVEKELAHYREAFCGARVLCNCDDPFESAFFRYFALNFDNLGLRSLTSTCYGESSVAGTQYPLDAGRHPYLATVTRIPDDSLVLPDGSLDLESLFNFEGNQISWLEGNGDFRSEECTQILKQADIVATNPPFSLFREYISQLIEFDKQFIILGNMNAATYKEVFPLFRDNLVWYGESIRSGDRKFHVPDSYPLGAANCGVDESGRRFIRVKGVRWFTNLENSRRREPLKLTKNFRPENYPRYDNYGAIEVGRTMDIPRNFRGLMGVPITFLDRYNPDQFEILMLANGNARTNVDSSMLEEVGYVPDPEDRGGVAMIEGRRSYARILIRKTEA